MFERFKAIFNPDKTTDTKKDALRRWKIKKRPLNGPVVKDKPIDYLLNDRSTPELSKNIMPPDPHHTLKYSVHEYKGGGFGSNTNEGRAANVFVTVTKTLEMMNRYSTKPLTRWAGTREMVVLPMAGTDFNAFYNRLSMQFFFAYDPIAKTPIFTSESSDIVAHELGHAILDSYRPDTWGVASLEVWSFHEAFADLTALLSIMQHDEVLEHVLNETKGELRVQSVMSRLAETMGRAIYNITDGMGARPKSYLRTTINDFKYVNPGTLPKEAPHNELAAECHSFGRVFLGAFYDMLEMIYKDGLSHGKTQMQALKHARDTVGTYTFKAIHHAPLCVNFYESVAKTMLWVAWNEPGKPYHDRMKNIFMKRNLMKREIVMLSSPPVDQNGDGIVALGDVVSVKLSDHIIRAQSQDNNPLYDVEIQAAQGEAYLYDQETGAAIDHISASEDEVLGALQDMIIYLHETGNVSDEESTPFAIENGKLIRTHFS